MTQNRAVRRRGSSPTMKDIARRANVSIGTVSRVLNRHADVDERLRQRVEAIARKLGYEFSARTRTAIQAKSRIIGLILCNDFGLSAAQTLLLLGVEEYCTADGYYLLFARHSHSSAASAAALEIPPVVQTPGLADCFIIAGTVYPNLLAAFDRHGLNYVVLANHVAGDPARSHIVQYDDTRGCCEAVRYLGQLGHRDIWYLGDDSKPWHRNRLNGYLQAISELKLDPHIHTIALSDDEFESGQAAVAHILEQGWPMTAILAGSDQLAFGAREGLHQHRREVPKDVSLIGFEHERSRGRASNLTSVSIDMAEVGRQLARAAIGKIEKREKESREIMIPAALVKRSTCRPLRKEDHMVL